MKFSRIFFSVTILFILFFSATEKTQSQGIHFFEGTWEEALEKAKKENKLVFVDAYAKWCGPCKVMSRNVFPDEKVGALYNGSFINLKLDMEESDGRSFGKKYPVNAFPTLLFLDGEGNLVLKHVGGMQVEAFLNLGKKAFALGLNLSKFADQYKEGDRSYETVYHYIRALRASGESTLKVANEFLLSNPDISIEEQALLVYESVMEADSRLFDLMVEHKEVILSKIDEEQYRDRVMDACNATIEKSVTYDVEMLKTEALDKCILALGKKEAEEKMYKLEMNYYSHMGDSEKYTDIVGKYGKKWGKKDPDVFRHILSHATGHFSEKPAVLNSISSFGEALYKNTGSSDDAILYIKLLSVAKEFNKALDFLETVEKNTNEEDKNSGQLKQIRKYLETMSTSSS